MKKIRLKAISLLFPILLMGCGSDTDTSTEANNFPTQSDTLVAFDKLATAALNSPVSLDLADSIKGADSQLVEITSDNPKQCYGYIEGLQSVNVEIAELGRCEYNYVVEDSSGAKATATLTLVSSTRSEPTLKSVSIPTFLETTYEVDLEEYHKDVAANYVLLNELEIIETQNGNSLENLINPEKTGDLKLKFTTPSRVGWYIIEYILVSNVLQEALIGHIYVSFGKETNQPPIINPKVLLYSNLSDVMKDKLITNTKEKITVNLLDFICEDGQSSGCLSISDPENQEWYLSHVNSTGGARISLIRNDLFNTGFYFDPINFGNHDVSYIVTDSRGASAIGTLRLYVNEEQFGEWRNWGVIASSKLFLPGSEHFDNSSNKDSCKATGFTTFDFKCYSPPFSHREGFNYYDNQEYHEDNGYLVSLWTRAKAEKHCEINNANPTLSFKLPSSSDLKALKDAYAKEDNEKFRNEFAKWPKEKCYFTIDGLFNLQDDDDDKKCPKDTLAYATCYADSTKE